MKKKPQLSQYLLISLILSTVPIPVHAQDNPDFTTSYDQVSEEAAVASLSSQNQAITGELQATVVRNDSTGVWTVYAAGSYTGAGGNATIGDTYMYGIKYNSSVSDTLFLNDVPDQTVLSPSFNFSINIPAPPLSWTSLSFGIHISDEAGKTANIASDPFPIIWNEPVLIDHAIAGTIIDDPNFSPNGIPSGIGIPHTLINGLPEADYYAVVFFEGLTGCPSNNYAINSFRPGIVWGYDTRGPESMFNKAWSTSAGGCMQEFHVDPAKGGDWLWGALSNTGSAPGIGDANEIPAFAICGTREACDRIAPEIPDEIPTDPPATTTPANLSSNVLFLPGIKGSYLYEKNPLCLIYVPLCDISLWLPFTNVAVSKLFMNASGDSLRNIYAKEGDVLKTVFGASFYDSFVTMMDQAQTDGAFGDGWRWKAIAYDWRMSITDLLSGGDVRDGNVYYGDDSDLPYIESSLHELASTSPTGKVTIVAHSNGGLVAKALLQKIGDTESARLVDSLILVGVPQSGAPRALGSLLYGEGESIPNSGILKNILMSAEQARTFAQNSPMAYHLLPSAAYTAIQNLSYPLIKFGIGATLQKERDAYGETIDSPTEFHEYILAENGERSNPAEDDLSQASIGNGDILSYAENLHASLDTWTPPAEMQVYQIGGYGVDTISGIQMYEERVSSTSSTTRYLPLFTRDGDSTVPSISSLLMNAGEKVHTTWVNLGVINSARYSHATMLEMPEIQNRIKTIISGNQLALTLSARTQPSFTSTQNVQGDGADQKRIAFFFRGEGTLSITDGDGRKAGQVEDTADDEIPGSQSGTFGEVTYVVVPANGTYSARVTSFRSQSGGIIIQDLDGDSVSAQTSLTSIPVSSSTTISFSVSDTVYDASSISIDTDGNSVVDQIISVRPNTATTAVNDTAHESGTSTPETVRTVSSSANRNGSASKVRASTTVTGASSNSPTPSAPMHSEDIVEISSPLLTNTVPYVDNSIETSSNGTQAIQITSSTTMSTSTITEPEEAQEIPSHEMKKSLWQRFLESLKKFFRDLF